MKLYELSENYLNLLELLENPEVPAEMVQAALNEVEGEIEDKAENIVKLIRSIEGDIEVLKAEGLKLFNKRKTLETKRDNLKMYLESSLKAIGKRKIKGGIFTLSMQKNAPKLLLEDLEGIPEEYTNIETVKVANKDKIKEDLKKGIEIKGAKLEQTESLRIR